MRENLKFFTLFKYVRTLVRVDKVSLLKCPIDLFHIPLNKGIKSRLRWTKYSDLYEIVHPSLDLIFFMFAHWRGMRERSFGVLVCGFADVFLFIYLFMCLTLYVLFWSGLSHKTRCTECFGERSVGLQQER